MKRYIRAATANLSKLKGNKFWDNSDENYEDLRQDFVRGLRAYWETCPYRLKKEGKKGTIIYNGLFGTGAGITIKDGAFPLKKGYYISNLVDDFCRDNNIPVSQYCRGYNYYIFANPYSRVRDEESSSSYGYNIKRIHKAQQEVYGETSKRKYSVTIHIGNFRKDGTNKYVVAAQSFVSDITLDSLKTSVSDTIYDVDVKDMLSDDWNEGSVEVKVKSDDVIEDYKNIFEEYFLSVFKTIPKDFIRVSVFEHLEY